jgi:hypothetical protein
MIAYLIRQKSRPAVQMRGGQNVDGDFASIVQMRQARMRWLTSCGKYWSWTQLCGRQRQRSYKIHGSYMIDAMSKQNVYTSNAPQVRFLPRTLNN